MGERTCVVVGAGMGGLAAAISAAEAGLTVQLVEKGDRFGGAAAYSGGQIWVGANHVAERLGMDDSVEDVLRYVTTIAASEPDVLRLEGVRQWVTEAPRAARYFEDVGVIRWEVIPDYPDYYYPTTPGSRPEGRYLTGVPFRGGELGGARPRLLDSPHFPSGITYEEMFSWGGMSSRTEWDLDLLARRRGDDVLTFGQGVAAAFAAGALRRSVDIRTSHRVVELCRDGDAVVGVRCEAPGGVVELRGPVILATGAHDWSPTVSGGLGISSEDGGSVAPSTLDGDALSLGEAAGAATLSLPRRAAPLLPGYRTGSAAAGGTGYRACFEHCLPHTFVVNRAGVRFCDDSFHPSIVAAALDPATGDNLPMFMIWDDEHRRRYGLGTTPPGGDYDPEVVTSAETLEELAMRLGVASDGLVATAATFNEDARRGDDPRYGRGSNLSVRRFRGDANHRPNPNVGPVERAPFHGMRLRLLGTGIASTGLLTGLDGRVLRDDDRAIRGLHAVGECAVRTAAGAGYNSGYSLSRAMTFGWLAARDVARDPASA